MNDPGFATAADPPRRVSHNQLVLGQKPIRRPPETLAFRHFRTMLRASPITPESATSRPDRAPPVTHTGQSKPTPSELQLPGSVEAVEPMTVVGRLGYADELLTHNEIGIAPDGGGPVIRIQVPPGLMGDIVRPMWGQRVAIKVIRRGNRFEFDDIDEA